MSLTIERQPEHLQPTHSDGLFFVLSTDKINTFKYRYVYEVYINGANIFTGKSTPNPSGLGVFDISDIVQTYIQNNPQINENEYVHLTEKFSRYTGYTNVAEVYVRFGEEYATGSTSNVIEYNGINDTQGIPALTSNYYKIYTGTLPYNSLSNSESFNVKPFILTGSPQSNISGLFLTNSPRIVDISMDDYHTLSFFNYNLNGGYISYPYRAVYDFYDINGTYLSASTVDNLVANGGGPLTGTSLLMYDSPIVVSDSYKYNILNIATGPKNIINILPPNTSYYRLTLFGVKQSGNFCSSGQYPAYIESCYWKYQIPVCMTSSTAPKGSFWWSSSTWNPDCFQFGYFGGPGGDVFSGSTSYIDCDECYFDNYLPFEPNQIALTGDPSTYSAVSETFQFNIVPDCEKYNNKQIMWRNNYGVYDYFKFMERKSEGIDISRSTYKQYPVSWGSSNPQKLPISRGLTDFYAKQVETHVINTGFINTAQMNYLESLFTSTDVYLIENDGTLFPINITSTEFIRKNKGNRDLVNILLTYTYSNNVELL